MDGKLQNANVEQISNFSWYRDVCKRFFDFVFSLIGILVLAIPMLLIAIVIKIDSPKEQILFRQKRVGKIMSLLFISFGQCGKMRHTRWQRRILRTQKHILLRLVSLFERLALMNYPSCLTCLRGR